MIVITPQPKINWSYMKNNGHMNKVPTTLLIYVEALGPRRIYYSYYDGHHYYVAGKKRVKITNHEITQGLKSYDVPSAETLDKMKEKKYVWTV